MCSVNEDNLNCSDLILDKTPVISDTCRKCKSQGVVVLHKKYVYCATCFITYVTHKFRATLGKSKIMKPQDKVLVAFSGSQACVALLHMLHSGLTNDMHKKLMFNVIVLYIDEGVLLLQSANERQKIVEEVKQKVNTYNLPFFATSLSEYFNESLVIDTFLKSNFENDTHLQKLFENVKTMSSKEDLLRILRQKLLIKAAEKLNCTKLFTAEVGTDLAVKLLSSFSLGRGDQAYFETAFCDDHHKQIKILRPLRNFTKKEIVFYNKFFQLEPISILSLTTKSSSKVSIQKLTEKFVTSLQENFPSTVYTIFKTGEKLSDESQECNNFCLLCHNGIKINNRESDYTAIKAANFSRNVSRRKSNNCAKSTKKSCCSSCSKEKEEKLTESDMEKFLCYGCYLICRDIESTDYLPKDLLQCAIEKKNMDTLKDQISEFLINPSSELEV